MGCDLGHVTCY